MDYERWDEQLEKDIADGKLEALAEEAISYNKEIRMFFSSYASKH
jgi:hypothetical protein